MQTHQTTLWHSMITLLTFVSGLCSGIKLLLCNDFQLDDHTWCSFHHDILTHQKYKDQISKGFQVNNRDIVKAETFYFSHFHPKKALSLLQKSAWLLLAGCLWPFHLYQPSSEAALSSPSFEDFEASGTPKLLHKKCYLWAWQPPQKLLPFYPKMSDQDYQNQNTQWHTRLLHRNFIHQQLKYSQLQFPDCMKQFWIGRPYSSPWLSISN